MAIDISFTIKKSSSEGPVLETELACRLCSRKAAVVSKEVGGSHLPPGAAGAQPDGGRSSFPVAEGKLGEGG